MRLHLKPEAECLYRRVDARPGVWRWELRVRRWLTRFEPPRGVKAKERLEEAFRKLENGAARRIYHLVRAGLSEAGLAPVLRRRNALEALVDVLRLFLVLVRLGLEKFWVWGRARARVLQCRVAQYRSRAASKVTKP